MSCCAIPGCRGNHTLKDIKVPQELVKTFKVCIGNISSVATSCYLSC